MPAEAAAKSGSMFLAVAVVSVVGLAAGYGFIAFDPQSLSPSARMAAAAAGAPDATRILDVPPVVTNLGSPAGRIVRLQVAIELDASAKKLDGKAFTGDLLAYLRSIPLDHLSGPAGLKHLREDLIDRLETRAGSPVKDVIIQDLVVQ